ncbi:hypothetical protein HNQ94_003744 [Salirhabdus euzebyi]|uniref:Anti-sigma-F factor Fin family protein n=1 Tax=Salirhabdus euzebyi TaxID=394506 RepID=A0A841QAJ5_9BACI|nr:anti-sigma-F factor Fin family protein [Salirhabdus euzebyi]MBB6455247.1 hypothetical protein [Salirhabdus euzebyi]
MSIKYSCRHCGNKIGQIEHKEIEEEKLGLNELSNEERYEMINYQNNGDVEVKTICEHCEETLNQNPSYHELDTFIQ